MNSSCPWLQAILPLAFFALISLLFACNDAHFLGDSGVSLSAKPMGEGHWVVKDPVYVNPPATSMILFGVCGIDHSNAWIVGSDGITLHWDGSTFTEKKDTGFLNNELFGVWGADPDNVWAVGSNHPIEKWDGSSWTPQPIPRLGSSLLDGFSVWGTDKSNVWVAASDILKWDGRAWNVVLTASTNYPATGGASGIWGLDANNIWAVGNGGNLMKWDGTTWKAQPSGTTTTLTSVWGSDVNNVWAVGNLGTIVRWDGRTWTAQPSGSTESFSSVWGTDANNVWAVGGGDIVKWDGQTWRVEASVGPAVILMGIGGIDINNMWAVGYSTAKTGVASGIILQRAP